MCRGKVQGRAADQEKKGRKRIKLMSCRLETGRTKRNRYQDRGTETGKKKKKTQLDEEI